FISSSCCRFLSALYFFWSSFICGACRCRFCIEWICLTVSGTSRTRTITVSATIDHAQLSPTEPWNQSRMLRRRSSSGVRIERKRIIERSRPRRDSRGYSGASASRRAASRARARACARRPARTASTSGGTCSGRSTGRRASSGRGRSARGRHRPEHALRTSCPNLSEDLLDALGQPVMPAALGRLGQARPDDEHVVVVLRKLGRIGPEDLPQLALHPVPDDRGPDGLRHREPEPRAFSYRFIVPREPVEDQETSRDRPALPVDGVEVARAREAMAAVHAPEATRRGASGPWRACA